MEGKHLFIHSSIQESWFEHNFFKIKTAAAAICFKYLDMYASAN